MSDENKAVVRQFFEKVINAANPDRANEFVTSNYVEHQQLPGAEGRQGIEVAKAFLAMMGGAFPDYSFDIEDLVAEGDKVVARVIVSGTHRGELMGLAPTDKRVRTGGIEVFRFEGGKMASFNSWALLLPAPMRTWRGQNPTHRGRGRAAGEVHLGVPQLWLVDSSGSGPDRFGHERCLVFPPATRSNRAVGSVRPTSICLRFAANSAAKLWTAVAVKLAPSIQGSSTLIPRH
jgi:predicted ester cyclase